ncbi:MULTISPECIES: tRNA pseudouridine(13) synthase TruD [unclassified Shewanella]|jgi:tRNA pseudouridine13 synthase|uniref:tRNA pseudouridine(13) synthase TruD n=1 Tax=unclassified Shewanella TaxID=196818 RepID=UPI0016025A19|nr:MULTISPECIES: tRNA pseudouridine(13) synthase TruD [unclassified Shewanella]MBB1361375.1 tRNA pseudouridine(13) synthase TruD [Shewanella sp. SR44-4]MBO1894592.1 tRNA pseudouridine(13) synthase TruD [Shewanella sp. BF02_Schw]
MKELHYLFGKPISQADLRTNNSDFIVKEILPFTPTGEGEHHMLHVRKNGMNTVYVAEILAKFAKVHPKEVTYAGQKDKNAITEQWFGIRIPGKETPEWTELNDDKLTILSSSRHSKKLRIGALLGNRFVLTLRNINDTADVESRLQQIAKLGVPNYFGEQRFGHDGKNLILGRQMLSGGRNIKDRHKRSMYLSAVRSNIFNQVVSFRLANHQVDTVAGDCVMLAGSKSYFTAEVWDDVLNSRLAEKDIQLSAPLWGRGTPLAQGEALALELTPLAELSADLQGLEEAGLSQERRPLLLEPQGMKWQFDADTLTLEFVLPAGSYATSVLRELADYQDVQESQRKVMVAEQQAQTNEEC